MESIVNLAKMNNLPSNLKSKEENPLFDEVKRRVELEKEVQEKMNNKTNTLDEMMQKAV